MNASHAHPQERIRLTGTPVGRMVQVLQQTPMTVLLCEHVELAIEHAVARHIWAEPA